MSEILLALQKGFMREKPNEKGFILVILHRYFGHRGHG